MLKASSDILNGLSCMGLLRAYIHLDEIRKARTGELDIEVKDERPVDTSSVIEEYRLHMEASAKSKNTIKDYCREIRHFLDHIKESSTSFSAISTSYLNSYLFFQKTERKLSINSYSRLVIVIRSFLTFLYKENIISKELEEKCT